jgi:hypothetical protein
MPSPALPESRFRHGATAAERASIRNSTYGDGDFAKQAAVVIGPPRGLSGRPTAFATTAAGARQSAPDLDATTRRFGRSGTRMSVLGDLALFASEALHDDERAAGQ